MEHQKLLDLLNEASNSKFVMRKWNIVNDNFKISMIWIVKKHIGYYYLLMEIQLYTLELSISLKKYYKKIRDKSITHNTFRIQDNESIMCIFYCITFIEYMLAGKTLLDYINFFSLNDYKKNGKIIHKCYKDKYGRRSKSWF